MTKISVCIDVSDKERAVDFYINALGLKLVNDNGAYIELSANGVSIYLSEKAAGTNPLLSDDAKRDYSRHWTPVHLDFHVEDIVGCISKIIEFGGNKEGEKGGEWGTAAFCSDPFGNGFCVLQFNK